MHGAFTRAHSTNPKISPTAELQLVEFAVAESHDIDCVTPDGRDYELSRRIAHEAYANNDDGGASRSATGPHTRSRTS